VIEVDAREDVRVLGNLLTGDLSLRQYLSLQDLSWRNRFDEHGLDVRIFLLEILDELLHDHELVTRQVHHQICIVGIADLAVIDLYICMERTIIVPFTDILGGIDHASGRRAHHHSCRYTYDQFFDFLPAESFLFVPVDNRVPGDRGHFVQAIEKRQHHQTRACCRTRVSLASA
jgi:hypothetical protein